MVSSFAIVFVLLGLLADANAAHDIDVCATTVSNFYLISRDRIFNQTTQFLLFAYSGSPLGTEADLYRQLLMDLGLTDTPDREQAFGKAFSQIIAANTRACTEYQGQRITIANTTEATAELRNALDTGSDLNSVRDIFGRALCLQSLVETGPETSFLTGLSGEDRGQIFGLAQRPYSLGFVVDDTGSMAAEIARVQQIILDFVNGAVGAPTHYILTSFNDPTVGVAVRYDAQDTASRQQLLAAVNALSANGGGDCPELGMTGIVNALDLSFPEGQLIVLTDASAKDSHRTDEVIQAAFQLGVRVHFAYRGDNTCGGVVYPFYDRVARETGGFSVYGLTNLDALSNAIQNARVNFVEANEAPMASGTCKAIPVSIFAENLYIAINPGTGTAVVTLQMPNGSNVFTGMTIPSLFIQNFNSPASGEWLICIVSGSVEVKQSQDIRFDITAEFLVQDDTTGLYVSSSTPPSTRSEVIALLFTSRLADLSTSLTHAIGLVDVTGFNIMTIPLLQCSSFLEGRFFLPSVEFRLIFYGIDNRNNSVVIDLDTYPAGPQQVTCLPSCQNGGICTDGNTCLCLPGYLGNTCNVQAVCTQPCANGGVCIDHDVCRCAFGYAGPTCNMPDFVDCIAPGDIAYCQNGGTCTINLLTDSLNCACTPDFIGDSCEQKVCAVTSVSPLLGSFEGGASVSLEVLPTCNLTAFDVTMSTCSFGDQTVNATVVDSMRLECVMPRLEMPGDVPFTFVTMYVTAEGFPTSFDHQIMFDAVQCPVAVRTPRPFQAYEVGGTTVSTVVSDPCSLASAETLSCSFGRVTVPAERVDANTATCVVPSMTPPGMVPFAFMSFSSAIGYVTLRTSYESLSCKLSSTPFISPTFGNMLGGTAITITIASRCSEEISGTPMCIFDGNRMVPAVNDSGLATRGQNYFCSLPMFETAGRVTFEFRAQLKTSGVLSLFDNFNILPPYLSHEVSVLNGISLIVDRDIRLTWSNDFSAIVTALPDSVTSQSVILLHLLLGGEGANSFATHTIRSSVVEGSDVIFHDTDIRNLLTAGQVVPGAFQVVTTVTGVSATDMFSYSRWSGVFLVASEPLSNAIRFGLGSMCNVSGQLDATGLPACPRTRSQALLFNSGFDEEVVTSDNEEMYREQYYGYFHPNSSACFVHQQPRGPNALTQQCCYDDDGMLLADAKDARPSIGTPLYQSIPSMIAYYRHTVLPFVYCCKEGLPGDDATSQCRDLQAMLPTDNGDDFRSPAPALLWGDPHLVTVDGSRYTFNGKGEFTLLEFSDDSFAFQGRFEQAVDVNGTLAQGTVCTAVVMTANTSDVVQMEVIPGSMIAVRLNGEETDLSMLSSQRFLGGAVTRLPNNTYQAMFEGGYFIEVSAENDILSLIKVTLPEEARGRTRGLLGNFNGNASDDFIPRNASEPIPAGSTTEEIHNQFGVSWILMSGEDSLFYYRRDMSWMDFHDPDFIPIFTPNFTDFDLETQAMALCGGDAACLFDVAATSRLDIGSATRAGSGQLDFIAALTAPVVCTPACANGACIATNTCHCPEFSGPTCSIPVFSSCDQNVCENGGTCTQHVFEYACECPPSHTGTYCEITIPSAIYGILGGVLAAAVVLTAVVILAVLLIYKLAPHQQKIRSRKDTTASTISFSTKGDSAAQGSASTDVITNYNIEKDVMPISGSADGESTLKDVTSV